ncbi:unnamed protein product [Urochloa humidicola]
MAHSGKQEEGVNQVVAAGVDEERAPRPKTRKEAEFWNFGVERKRKGRASRGRPAAATPMAGEGRSPAGGERRRKGRTVIRPTLELFEDCIYLEIRIAFLHKTEERKHPV